MNLRKPIELSVLFYNDEQCKLKDLGLIGDTMPDLNIILIYSLDGISPCDYHGHSYSSIHFNGTEMIVPMSYYGLKQLIEEHI